MENLEKVIRKIEYILDENKMDDGFYLPILETVEVLEDALELLKAQEQEIAASNLSTALISITGRYCPEDVCELEEAAKQVLKLLKEKEEHISENGLKVIKKGNVYECPHCGEEIFSDTNPNYCGFCGRKVDWNG